MLTRNVITIGVRELKAKTSEILRRLEEKNDLEIIITRHGKPCARLVSARRYLPKLAEKVPESDRISILGAYPNLPELTDKDFKEVKRIWEPKPIE